MGIYYYFLFSDDILSCMSGAGIDLSSLIIVDGKVCWDLYIDGLVISSDGNLLDALAAAIKVIYHGMKNSASIFLHGIYAFVAK